MRLRQLVLACGLTSFALSPYVSALGLGEVTLKSSLNQPLEAEVKLLDTRDLTADQILVALAAPADFERNGVDRLYFYTEFQFEVVLEGPGAPKVVITSRSPVREPYLNFLIEARWTAGRLLREYTLLMDLPTFDDNPSSQAVHTATQSAPQRQQTTSQVSRTPEKKPEAGYQTPRQVTSTRSSLDGDQYEVRQNDTLWDIALRARPDSSVSVHQSMMALYQANPDAFINGNINRLRRGQVLRIPDAQEMRSLNRADAVRQFAQATGDSEYGAQLSGSRRTSAAPTESTGASGRVKLAAPSSGTGTGQGSGANDGSGKSLESELSATLEELDKSKSENNELSARVRDLEEQIQTMERLVEVSNEKLRALQVAAVQTNGDAASSSDAALAAVAPAASQTAVASSASAQSSKPAAPARVVTPPQPTLADKAIENAPWIGLGVLALIGAGVFAYRRRKQEETQQEEQDDIFAMDDSVAEHADFATEPEAYPSEEDASLFEEESETTAVAETGDVVGEADIYIAYGKLDQAEEMLLNALQKDPNSTDIRMKLLEVYAQQQNAPAFDKHYSVLLPLAGAAVLARASELRDGIAGASEFDAGAVTQSDAFESGETFESDENSSDFLLDDLNLDDDLVTANTTPADTTFEENADFDFSLDLDDHEDNLASSQEEAPVQNAEHSFATPDEFELNLDDDFASASDADDLSELSLALDDLDTDLSNDSESTTASMEEEFSFDLEEDLELAETTQDGEARSFTNNEFVLDTEAADGLTEAEEEPLDVVADDFNLDMDVEGVDLAALDHEMESLDLEDLDDDYAALDGETEATVKNNELLGSLNVDDAVGSIDLESENEFSGEFGESEIAAANLDLTDDLDKLDQSFGLDNESDDFALDVFAETETETEAEAEAEELASDLATELTLDDNFDLSEVDNDDVGMADEFASDFGSDSVSKEQPVVDLELQDEIPVQTAVSLQNNADQHEEDLFAQALSDFPGEDDLDLDSFSSDEAALEDLSDEDMDAELDFLADADEAATKLDLARAYIDMGDAEGAKDILSEVLGEGSEEQRKEANELLGRIG
jgi:pilus assembly protein FimV